MIGQNDFFVLFGSNKIYRIDLKIVRESSRDYSFYTSPTFLMEMTKYYSSKRNKFKRNAFCNVTDNQKDFYNETERYLVDEIAEILYKYDFNIISTIY